MKEIPSTAVMPPTPPPTPRRRGWSESTSGLPGTDRIQQMSRDINKVLYYTPENTEDQMHKQCGKILSDSILWQVFQTYSPNVEKPRARFECEGNRPNDDRVINTGHSVSGLPNPLQMEGKGGRKGNLRPFVHSSVPPNG